MGEWVSTKVWNTVSSGKKRSWTFMRILSDGIGWGNLLPEEGKGPLERPKRRWDYNIKIDIKGI
jgi:hypothetical protein